MKEHPESWYQSRIIKALNAAFPSAFIWKAAAGPYSRGGIPDLCMIYKGHFFGIEVKRPGGRTTVLQAVTLRAIQSSGGTALVAIEPETAVAAVREWERKESEHDQSN